MFFPFLPLADGNTFPFSSFLSIRVVAALPSCRYDSASTGLLLRAFLSPPCRLFSYELRVQPSQHMGTGASFFFVTHEAFCSVTKRSPKCPLFLFRTPFPPSILFFFLEYPFSLGWCNGGFFLSVTERFRGVNWISALLLFFLHGQQ